MTKNRNLSRTKPYIPNKSRSFKSLTSHAKLYAMGKSLRKKHPHDLHAKWKPSKNRPDPIKLLKESNKGRLPELVPIRYGRMMQSPFHFFRGAALNMAEDLSITPISGLRVQACGDCHLVNFGAYATPERRVVIDINDLDETLPAPWEWDIKRLTTSFVLACRNNNFSENQARDAALACVRSYRKNMAKFSEMPVLDVWYASLEVEQIIEKINDRTAKKRIKSRLENARERSTLEHDFPKLVMTSLGNVPTIKDDPPLIYHLRKQQYSHFAKFLEKAFTYYRNTLPEYRRLLLDRFKVFDIALKVVGVGSVGTRCYIMLLMASEHDPLFLQIKEARPSVLEKYAGKSIYSNHGQRVVIGYQLLQTASDHFLGWTFGQEGHHFYIRQLRDMKIKPLVELFSPSLMIQYAKICGWVLARAHARCGQPAKISGYLGKNDKFDQAIGDFSIAYADQSESDHERFKKAVRSGKIEIQIEKKE